MIRILFFCLFISQFAFGQGIINGDGAKIIVGTGAYLVTSGDGNIKNDGSGELINSGTITIANDFQNNGTGTINNSGTLTIAGDWVNNASGAGLYVFSNRDGTGLVVLNGSSTQTISGSSTRFENLTVNNSATGNAIVFSSNQIVENTLNLSDGVITTGANHLILESTTPSDLTAFSNTSFINGNLRRYITGTGSYIYFPVGNGTTTSNYQLTAIAPIILDAGSFEYLDVSFNSLAAGGTLSLTEDGTTFTDVAAEGEWAFITNTDPTAIKYNIRLYTANISSLVDNEFVIVGRDIASSDAADWDCSPCGVSSGTGDGINDNDLAGRLITDGYTERRGLTSFAKFGIATTGSTPLPIELLHFDANLVGSKVLLDWQTASELNNDYFTVEKTKDNLEWKEVSIVKGAGNSTTQLSYNSTDYNPYEGVSYYRLKQTDFDGKYEYSNIVAVNNDRNGNEVVLFPNPTNDKFYILTSKDADYKVDILDATGKTVYKQDNLTEMSTQNFPNGLYLVRINFSNGDPVTMKLIVNK